MLSPGTGISRYLFPIILAGTFLVAALLLLVNLHLGAVTLVLVNGVLLLVSLALLIIVHGGGWSLITSLVYLSAVVINILATLITPGIQPGAASSLALIPVLAYILLEIQWAFPFTFASLAAAVLMYFLGAQAAHYRLNPRYAAHALVPALMLFLVCHLYSLRHSSSVNHILDRTLRDPLTGLWNREKLANVFSREKERALQDGTPLSLILIDLDHFKSVNDRYGHDAGDGALAFVAQTLINRLRTIDLATRVGGEEFAVLLPGTPGDIARRIAEDLRRNLEKDPYYYQGHAIQLTLSAGVCEFGADGTSWEKLYRTADTRLYSSKSAGRNRTLGG